MVQAHLYGPPILTKTILIYVTIFNHSGRSVNAAFDVEGVVLVCNFELHGTGFSFRLMEYPDLDLHKDSFRPNQSHTKATVLFHLHYVWK